MVAASIDTHTGDVILFSLPRNLQKCRCRPARCASSGRTGSRTCSTASTSSSPTSRTCWPARATAGRPDQVGGVVHPRHPIDYYAMVNLEGFNEFIDAIGGVTIDVTQRLPIGGLLADGTRVPPVGYIEPGVQHLTAARPSGTRDPAGTAPTTTGCSGSAA
jgi:hypothetical protein